MLLTCQSKKITMKTNELKVEQFRHTITVFKIRVVLQFEKLHQNFKNKKLVYECKVNINDDYNYNGKIIIKSLSITK